MLSCQCRVDVRNGKSPITKRAFADLALALMGNIAGVLIGVALWGLHMGLTEGLLAALVAVSAPVRLRGTAFGLFNLATGVAMLAASALAGAIWSARGASLTFLTGGGVAVVALVGVLALLKDKPTQAETAHGRSRS